MDMKESGKENIKTSESSKPSLKNDKEVKKEVDELIYELYGVKL